MFQSSPVPKDGCNLLVSAWMTGCNAFQSSPVPKDGCNSTATEGRPEPAVSILTRPEGRVQRPAKKFLLAAKRVSILTRPEGRVQHIVDLGELGDALVSILTRPEGRVQPPNTLVQSPYKLLFQSSPVPKDGCNVVQPR